MTTMTKFSQLIGGRTRTSIDPRIQNSNPVLFHHTHASLQTQIADINLYLKMCSYTKRKAV